MKEFSIPLISEYQRPVIEIYKLPALIDTGAIIPVVSIFPSIFEKYFDTKIISTNGYISGFGGIEKGSVYSISDFKIGEFIFNEFEVFVPNSPKLKFPFLLSATLFYGTAYEIDTVNKKFTLRMESETLPRCFKIKKLNGKLFPQVDGILLQDIDLELESFYIF